jgi:hypothetical protein
MRTFLIDEWPQQGVVRDMEIVRFIAALPFRLVGYVLIALGHGLTAIGCAIDGDRDEEEPFRDET